LSNQEDKRLKVVFVGGSFPDDEDQFGALSRFVDVIVYGTRFRSRHYLGSRSANLAEPPRFVRTRAFEPIVHSQRGHLFWAYRGFGRALTADRPDVVHVLSEPWGLLPLQAAWWARRNPGCALVIHGCDRIWWHGSSLEQAVRRRLSIFTLRRTDGYAAESAEAVRRAQEAGLPKDVPAAVVHTNPRDPKIFCPPKDEEDRVAARRRLGLQPEGIAVGFIGNLIERKGPVTFLSALKGLDGRPDADVWGAIAGRGVLEDRVRAEAPSSGAVFLGCLEFPEGVRDFFQSMDIVCVPSQTTDDWDEQSPRVVIEAMLSGCAVVASDCGATREMVGNAGIVVRERDPVDLRRGILTALKTIRSGDPIGRRASARAIAIYSGNAVADRLVEIWRRAHDRRRHLEAG
jgi:glycosyltransferase involved in cell wall biosynthesis